MKHQIKNQGQNHLTCYNCGASIHAYHDPNCSRVPDGLRRKVCLFHCGNIETMNPTPQRLTCRDCDAPIDLCHFPGCAYRFAGQARVKSKNCNFDNEYKLPEKFESDLGTTYYCQLRSAYLNAQRLVLSIERLCDENNINIPAEQ